MKKIVAPREYAASFSCYNERGINTSYGRTVEFRVTNLSDIEIHDWELVIPVSADMYINKAWNGEVEFSQFGGKNTDKFNTMQAVHGEVGIESAILDELTVFPVAKGDQIIYYPNADYGEFPITGSAPAGKENVSTTIGIIFYTTGEEIDLSDGYIRYHLNKTITQLPVFWVLLLLLMVFASVILVCLIVIIVGKRYEQVQKEANEKAERALGDALRMAEEANRAKTIFLSNMSHDIRTPMNAIIGFTNIALKQEPKPEVRECLEKIGESSEHLLTLINDVLDISRIESGKTQYKGTGLGMSIAKQYVELMGGTITVQSKKGSGSSFTVELPMELTDVEKVRKQEPPAAKADLTGVRILLAEDNDLNAEIAEVQLKECGMQVTRVADGQEAVDAFTSHPTGTFDIILMDIMMPNMNGYEAAKAIRNQQNRPDGCMIPIIAMTANAFAEDVQTSLEAGMNGHLSKPIVIDEVVKTITRNLDR